jgi:hypothetical protein
MFAGASDAEALDRDLPRLRIEREEKGGAWT